MEYPWITGSRKSIYNTIAAVIDCEDLGGTRHHRYPSGIDRPTYIQCLRTAAFAKQIGSAMNISDDRLWLGVALRDSGKALYQGLCNRAGRLTSDERRAITRHCEYSYLLVAKIDHAIADRIADTLFHHHERTNGTGYPDRLIGDEIPVHARIASVVDVFDAMTHNRPYSPRWAPEGTLDYLRIAVADDEYDKRCVDALETVISKIAEIDLLVR